jgi:hypothetical protein
LLLQFQFQDTALGANRVSDRRQRQAGRSQRHRHAAGQRDDSRFEVRVALDAIGDQIRLGFIRPAAAAAQAEPRVEVAPLQHHRTGGNRRSRGRIDVAAEVAVNSALHLDIPIVPQPFQQMGTQQGRQMQRLEAASQIVSPVLTVPFSGVDESQSLVERHGALSPVCRCG